MNNYEVLKYLTKGNSKHFLPPVNGGKPQENSISVIKRW